ncbi:MAG: ROK family protein, partial [Pseudonocardiaceae bacterium]
DGIRDITRSRGLGAVQAAEDHRYSVGVAILRDRLVGVLTNLRGDPLSKVTVRALEGPAPPAPVDERTVAAEVGQLVRDLRHMQPDPSKEVVGLGVNLAGHVDATTGHVLHSPVLGWRTPVPLQRMLEEETQLPTVIENDANALALHQLLFGAGQSVSNFVVVMISDDGRGIGAGLVIDDNLYRGNDRGAGEIGHMVVEPGGRRCRCGQKGCLEAVVGVGAILEFIKSHGGPALKDVLEVRRLATQDDHNGQLAREALTITGERLGRGISYLVQLFNPAQVILVGPSALLGPNNGSENLYVKTTWATVTKLGFTTLAKNCKQVTESPPQDSGARAAAVVAVNRFAAHPPIASPNLLVAI